MFRPNPDKSGSSSEQAGPDGVCIHSWRLDGAKLILLSGMVPMPNSISHFFNRRISDRYLFISSGASHWAVANSKLYCAAEY